MLMRGTALVRPPFPIAQNPSIALVRDPLSGKDSMRSIKDDKILD